MQKMMLTTIIVTMVLSVSVFGNLLTNGSFETGPPKGSASYRTVSGGSTAITGWLVTGSTIDIVYGPPWDVSDRTRAIDLDGAFSIGGIQQTISTIIGQTYTVSFDLSGNPGWPHQSSGPKVKSVRVGIDSFSQDYSFDTAGLVPGTLTWSPISFDFTASGTSETLSFSSLSSSSSTPSHL